MKVAILDDRTDFVLQAENAVKKSYPDARQIVTYTGELLTRVVNRLLKGLTDHEVVDFDDIDIFLLDYDLTTNSDIGLTTGADIAKLLRSLTLCGPIILTNAYAGTDRDKRFDLNLEGDLTLMSDFETASSFLGNPGLWQQSDWDPFRPWVWPVLPELSARLRDRSSEFNVNLDSPIIEIIPELGEHLDELTPADSRWMGEDVLTVTPNDIASGRSGRSLLAPIGVNVHSRVVGRFAASRVIKWLERFVLVRGTSLIDLPQLVTRMPRSVEADLTELIGNIPTTDVLEPDIRDLKSDLSGSWCGRDVWWESKVRSSDTWVLRDKRRTGIDAVFCEDASRFKARELAVPYTLPVPSAFRQRWLSADAIEGSSVIYQPAQWLMV